MPFYYSSINGCVYTLDANDPNVMLYTPMSSRNIFDGNVADWSEVDFMLLMDEDITNRTEAEYALSILTSWYERYKADQ